MQKLDQYWQSDWYRAEQGLPPLPDQDLPSDDDLLAEIAPYDGDPIATRKHIDKRLHNVMEALARNAEKGDIQSARALVATAERRAKLLGLDAPKEVQLEVTRREPTSAREMTTAELRQVIEGESTRVED